MGDLYAKAFSGTLGHKALAELSRRNRFSILKAETPSEAFKSAEPWRVKRRTNQAGISWKI